MDQLFDVIGSDYILAVEGAVSLKDNGSYNVIGRHNGREITGYEAVKRLGEQAAHVIAVGAALPTEACRRQGPIRLSVWECRRFCREK